MVNYPNMPKYNSVYKDKARMRSLLKAIVIQKLQLKAGGVLWYESNKEPLRRLVFDACEKYPVDTKAEYKLHEIADVILKQIEADQAWKSL